ncbi:hypothetical protein U0035_08695 [Niabella yanshanensis]|uniref:DUF3592 domain-containing protein n=1 Tax=Niabella yanshanensis TaxID=577386 RepID=A0ABZ0WAK7_9BACT|nr:hypothetical protein [Niabella yanshanensis]WQD40221.1 hypothetical protein U0035_08695 [Niabella yanshanensis]
MEIIYWRVLFFCLIPIGIFLLIKGIRLVGKSLSGTVLLEIPYLQKTGQFTVVKAGYFSIWQKGTLLKRTPVDQFRPYVYNELTNETLMLNFSLMRPQVNSFSAGRIQIATFRAEPGNYKLELGHGTSLSKWESLLANAVLFPKIDLTKYFIEVRTSQSPLFIFLAIPLILLGAFGIICGVVLGLLADQIVK